MVIDPRERKKYCQRHSGIPRVFNHVDMDPSGNISIINIDLCRKTYYFDVVLLFENSKKNIPH